jgi:hypothetical protein
MLGGYMALPQALRTAISAIADTRASGGLALSAVDRGGPRMPKRRGQTAWFVLGTAGLACTGTRTGPDGTPVPCTTGRRVQERGCEGSLVTGGRC